MIGTIILIVYLIGLFIVPYPIFKGLLRRKPEKSYSTSENETIFGYVVFTVGLSAAWPLFIPLGVSYILFNRTAKFSLDNEIAKLEEEARTARRVADLRKEQRRLQNKREAEAERIVKEIIAELDEISGTPERISLSTRSG